MTTAWVWCCVASWRFPLPLSLTAAPCQVDAAMTHPTRGEIFLVWSKVDCASGRRGVAKGKCTGFGGDAGHRRRLRHSFFILFASYAEKDNLGDMAPSSVNQAFKFD
ncbi:unnamed protein product [Chondrus crispus]|uniref:Secreted protein n=1 Tax=Chondrus crispus TaxID=2769 RepID=R7QIR7_CHOCR|nr:unnamed protein product [Chondrus crispus]CDF37643.1 unnamed protein product [Chondrus crispus]|eukprot:XP_005717514.1 unnamed protein product [Chondrus crispus]